MPRRGDWPHPSHVMPEWTAPSTLRLALDEDEDEEELLEALLPPLPPLTPLKTLELVGCEGDVGSASMTCVILADSACSMSMHSCCSGVKASAAASASSGVAYAANEWEAA